MFKKCLIVLISISYIVTVILLVLAYYDISNSKKGLEVHSCVPYNVEVTDRGDNYISISWRTKENCLSFVRYGESEDDLIYTLGESSSSLNNNHAVKLTDLDPDKDYYFFIVSDGITYGYNGGPLLTQTRGVPVR